MQRYMWTNSPCWSWRLMRFDRRGGLMHKNPSRLKTSPLEPCNSHVELCRHLMRGQVVGYLPRVGWVPAHSRTATDKHATQQTESAENISQQSEKITLFFFSARFPHICNWSCQSVNIMPSCWSPRMHSDYFKLKGRNARTKCTIATARED